MNCVLFVTGGRIHGNVSNLKLVESLAYLYFDWVSSIINIIIIYIILKGTSLVGSRGLPAQSLRKYISSGNSQHIVHFTTIYVMFDVKLKYYCQVYANFWKGTEIIFEIFSFLLAI